MDDDRTERTVELAPQVTLARSPSGKDVVRSDDRTGSGSQQPAVELRERRPLHVENVARDPAQASQADAVLDGLDRQPERRA